MNSKCRCEKQSLRLWCLEVCFLGGGIWSRSKAAVDSSCWEFECSLEYPGWRMRRGPPQCSDVTLSSREFFTFLFLAVVRSFPENWGKNTVGLFSGAFGSWKVEGARRLRLKTHGGLKVSLALAPLCCCNVSVRE